ELGRGGITVFRVNFETAQDDLLQPGLESRIESAWGHRIPPQPPAPSVDALGFAEGTSTCREQIKNDPEGKKVAAGIGAIAENLFGRDVGSSSDRSFRVLLYQVGQLIVPRQSEIDQNRIVSMQDHIARLQIEMDHVLTMDVVQSKRNFC